MTDSEMEQIWADFVEATTRFGKALKKAGSGELTREQFFRVLEKMSWDRKYTEQQRNAFRKTLDEYKRPGGTSPN